MPRFRALFFLIIFFLSVFGRGFAFRNLENPFRYFGGFSQISGVAEDEGPSAGDEFEPLNAFQAKIHSPAVSIATPARLLSLIEYSHLYARHSAPESRIALRIATSPRLRPPIILT